MKFQVGQRVKCINQPEHYNEHDRLISNNVVYTVKDYVGNSYVVLKEIKRAHNFREDRFELANDLLPEDLFTL